MTTEYRVEYSTFGLGLGLGLTRYGAGGSGDGPEVTYNTVWNTANAGVSASNQIQIPLTSGATYNFDWETSDGQTGTHTTDADLLITFAVSGIYTLKIGGVNNTFPSIRFNNGGDKLKLTHITNWGNIEWQAFERAYYGTTNASVPATLPPDLSQCSLYRFAFGTSTMNPDVSDWGMSAATSFNNMYANNAPANPDVSNWDTSSLTACAAMFQGAANANPDMSGWDWSGITTATNCCSGSAFDTTNYDALLLSLDAQTLLSGKSFHAGTACYSPGAATTARDSVITNDLWTFTDGGQCNSEDFNNDFNNDFGI